MSPLPRGLFPPNCHIVLIFATAPHCLFKILPRYSAFADFFFSVVIPFKQESPSSPLVSVPSENPYCCFTVPSFPLSFPPTVKSTLPATFFLQLSCRTFFLPPPFLVSSSPSDPPVLRESHNVLRHRDTI